MVLFRKRSVENGKGSYKRIKMSRDKQSTALRLIRFSQFLPSKPNGH